MPVSVVIASTLDSPVLESCVDAAVRSAAAVGPDAEVLLVANRVRGGRPPRVDSPLLRVLHSSPDGTATARNTAIEAARHDTVLFTDDDLIVAENWAPELYAALRTPGCAAVGTPVRTAVAGPVTSFMNYDRLFDAPPTDAHRARLLVTASAGYRRDLAPQARFNTERHQFFGQDTEFALTLADQGLTVRWLPDAPAPVHHLEEDIASVVTRAVKNGRGSARLYLARRLVHSYVPAPQRAYAGLAGGSFAGYRKYREVDSTGVRAVYATVNLLRTALILAGYLADVGAAFGHDLVELDQDGLVEGFRGVLAGLAATVPDEPWADVPVRLGPGYADAPAIEPHVPAKAVAAVLTRFARPSPQPLPPEVAEVFGRDDLAWYERHLADRARITALWRQVEAIASTLTVADFEARARAAGLALPAAFGLLEHVVGQPATRAGWPGAAPAPAAHRRAGLASPVR